MIPFTYQYKGETIESLFAISVDKGDVRIKVKLTTDLWFTIAPFGFTAPGEKIIWIQSNKEGEIVQPHELVQAIGEGIEATGWEK